MKIQQIIKLSSVKVKEIIEKRIKKEGINLKKIEYSTSGVILYLNKTSDVKPDPNSKELIKIEQIIELSPMEVKMIIQKYLEKNGLMVRKIKLNESYLTVYLPDAPATKKELKSLNTHKKFYRDEQFSSLPAPTGLINRLQTQGIERLSQLEDYLMLKIANDSLLTPEIAIVNVHLLGVNYYKNLIDILKQKNIKISSTGKFEPIS